MSVLLDTSFLFAFKNTRDADHVRAVELFREVLRGQHGASYTTDFVFAEAVTVCGQSGHRSYFPPSRVPRPVVGRMDGIPPP